MSGRSSWLLAVLALPVLAMVGMLFFAVYYDPAVPTATVVATLPNPGGTFIAVVEKVDNGMGFGQGMLYDEIHLLRHGEAVAGHGDESKTSIFYLGDAAAAPEVRWTDDQHLSVSYAEGPSEHAVTRPGMNGLVVTYHKQAPQR
jgi:hypothetical protein